MNRSQSRSLGGAVLAILLTATVALAQTPPPTNKQGPPPGRGMRNRPPLPAATANMTPQQLQAQIDGYALVQAERELQLTEEQYPNFVRRHRRLQEVRRRHQMEKRQIMVQLNGLLQGSAAGRDESIMEKVRALDDVSQRLSAELRKAYDELDSVLTPWQRGRFRLFEEQLERLKVQLLSKIGAGG